MPKTDSTPETFEETLDRANGTIDAACVEIDRLRAVNADLLAACLFAKSVILANGAIAMEMSEQVAIEKLNAAIQKAGAQ